MDLERVIAALAPRDVVGRASLDVADLAYDTRAITPGALFFCVRGANVDGHELAPQALALQRTFREMLDAGDRSCAMEASSHASELHRLDRVRFAALVFTNLTPDHLDFHGPMERYFDAKRRLFVGDDPPAAINLDDPWGRKLAAERPD